MKFRRMFRIFILIVCAMYTPMAWATDLRIEYFDPLFEIDELIIEADGDGNFTSFDNSNVESIGIARVDGIVYVALFREDITVKLDDLIWVRQELGRRHTQSNSPNTLDEMSLQVAETGITQVDTWPAMGFEIRPSNGTDPTRIMISEDTMFAEYAELASTVFRHRIEASFGGVWPNEWIEARIEILDQGMPLQFESWTLGSGSRLEDGSIEIAIPNGVLSREELLDRLEQQLMRRPD